MEGNFLSRYNNKLEEFGDCIKEDPSNKNRYESEMSDYVMQCMPYMNRYIDESTDRGKYR